MSATTTSLTAPAPAPAAQLMQFFTAKWIAPSIGVLARLGIADLVADGPRSPAELADSTGAEAHALCRVLRAAASVGVFAENGDGRFGLTPMAECLRSAAPGSLRPAAMLFTSDEFWRPYGHLAHTVMTGEPAFVHLYGTDVYGYLEQHPEAARLFAEAAAGFYAASTPPVVAAYDYSTFRTVVDVGGGIGFLLAGILDAHPQVRGVLLERPSVIGQAREVLAARGLAARVELVAGDFFESVPAGGDLYLVKSCLHNFRDDEAVRLLHVLGAAMGDGVPLLVVDSVVPPGNEPHYAKLDDVEMLTIAGGLDRRADEWEALLAAGGFSLARILPTSSGMVSVLEAFPSAA